MGAGEVADFAGRAADTAANVEDLEVRLDANVSGQVMFVAGNGLMERLAGMEPAEVEGCSPGVLCHG